VKIGNLHESKFWDNLVNFLKEFKTMFSWTYKDMFGIDYTLYQHKIDLKASTRPIQQQYYRMNIIYANKLKEDIDKLL